VLCAATHGVLPDAKMSQTPLPAGPPPLTPAAPLAPPATPESPAMPPRPPNPELTPPELALEPPELALTPPELALEPPELALAPPELALEPPELALTPPELPFTPPELAVVPPELEVVPPELAPPDAASAPPVAPFELDPPEQPPTAAIAMIAAPASNAGRGPETTEREVLVVDFADFMRELYYVHARGHASTDAGGNLNCSGTAKPLPRRGAAGDRPARASFQHRRPRIG